jgi:hypothetical protein
MESKVTAIKAISTFFNISNKIILNKKRLFYRNNDD